jgi:UTP--glucose-1-phosphate uridylyltransferase
MPDVDSKAGGESAQSHHPCGWFWHLIVSGDQSHQKELFPIIDQDGIAKPAILLIVEEALNAGLEEVIIIVQEHDLEDFRAFFNEQITIENYNKLPRHFQEYARRILEIGRRVSFVVQTTQEGFGHAIYCAREVVGNEPFLLMLGDHIYRSNGEQSCAQRLVEAYSSTVQMYWVKAHARIPDRQFRHRGGCLVRR